MDCSLPVSSVHGIFQARILEWVGYHFLHQGIFLTQGSNQYPLDLLHWQADALSRSHQGSPQHVDLEAAASTGLMNMLQVSLFHVL